MHNKHVPRLPAIASLGAALVLLASMLGSLAATPRSSGAASPRYGGTLHIAYSGDAVTFDPAQAFDDDWLLIQGTLYNGLYLLDGQGQPHLDLAAVPPTISADRKVWTFHLRHGVLFHNGSELTADDVRFSLLRVLDPHLKPSVSWGQPTDDIFEGSHAFVSGKTKDVPGIQVLDRYTIRFVLTQPVAILPYILAESFNMIVPKAVVTAESPSAFASHPIGTGPYMLQSWQKGTRVVFVRNPRYFHPGRPYLDKIIADINVAPNLIALRVEKGELDGFGYAPELAAADLQQARTDPTYSHYLVTTPVVYVDWLDLNVHAAPLNSLALRQAIAMAIRRPRLVQLLGGTAEPAQQLYVPTEPQYDHALDRHPPYPYDPTTPVAWRCPDAAAMMAPNSSRICVQLSEQNGSVREAARCI